jgi:hypothetical protein
LGAAAWAVGLAPNCRVTQVIDAERFLALFLDRLCPASS